ncbi:hypothetical protein RHSIM_Rhsim09G0032200 [Rhododendron simsii]|uniref:Putative gamma-glutamylcyclotransferase n=1 Tax=Rhododendron simsii TaxID=118357 RepID=A0A834GC69_RHOSS|nr:hypothetical protein RHSIM_Rhsim09G0032200 [Rhododendron simsii]
MGSSSMSTGQRLHNVFVYGSLLADEDVTIHRFSIKGRVYPALLPVENKKVTGRVGSSNFIIAASECYVLLVSHGPHGCLSMLQAKNHVTQVLSGITDPELDVLDTFEDAEYERRTIEVSLMEWRLAHMKDFINMTTGFMEELELPESKPRVDTYESFYKQSGDTTPMS